MKLSVLSPEVPVSSPAPSQPSAEATRLDAPGPVLTAVELVTEGVSPQKDDRPTLRTELRIAASTFVTIFLAELGDKTQFTTLLMSAESHSPWTVFAGAGLALVTTSLLGVMVGCWLSQRVSPKTLERAAGVMLLVIAATLFWDVLHP